MIIRHVNWRIWPIRRKTRNIPTGLLFRRTVKQWSTQKIWICTACRVKITRNWKRMIKTGTVTEIQLTTTGVKDFGFGQPYSILNTDTLCNGKRKNPGYLLWSPDSRHFAVSISDSREVKDLWVINAMATPRPTLETYKYQMPGEKEAPISHLYLFDMNNNSYKEINTWLSKTRLFVWLTSPVCRNNVIWRNCRVFGWVTITVSSLPVPAVTCTVSTSVPIPSVKIRFVRLSKSVWIPISKSVRWRP